jgi:transcriptional regulator with XRE-family HTH domain
MNSESIGLWVKSARKHKGWTQAELAQAMDVTSGNVSHWERGQHEPSHSQVKKIAAVTGYPMEEWPFPRVQSKELTLLAPRQKHFIENLVIVGLGALKELDPGDGGKEGPAGSSRRPKRAY